MFATERTNACEYCHSPEKISTSRFTIDHLQSRSLGGDDTEENLANEKQSLQPTPI